MVLTDLFKNGVLSAEMRFIESADDAVDQHVPALEDPSVEKQPWMCNKSPLCDNRNKHRGKCNNNLADPEARVLALFCSHDDVLDVDLHVARITGIT